MVRTINEMWAGIETFVDKGMDEILSFQNSATGAWPYRKRANSYDATKGNVQLLHGYLEFLHTYRPHVNRRRFETSHKKGVDSLLSLYDSNLHDFNEHLKDRDPQAAADWVIAVSPVLSRDDPRIRNTVETLKGSITATYEVATPRTYRMQNKILAAVKTAIAINMVGEPIVPLEQKILSNFTSSGPIDPVKFSFSDLEYWVFNSFFKGPKYELTSTMLTEFIERLYFFPEQVQMKELRRALLENPIPRRSQLMFDRFSKPTLLSVARALFVSDPENRLENLPHYLYSAIGKVLDNPPRGQLHLTCAIGHLHDMRAVAYEKFNSH